MSFTQTGYKPPYDYIQRHYKEPATSDPIKRWLPHPEVARAICFALLAGGVGGRNVQDALQDVYVKVLTAFRNGAAVPGDLGAMKAYCAAAARNHAIDTLRKGDKRKRDFLAAVDPEEHAPLEYAEEKRDPVDAGRQMEVLADLFREGLMPQDGVRVLRGIALQSTLEEIGQDLGINMWAVRGRIDTMRKVFRARMAKLGLLPGMLPLRVIVSAPAATATLKEAA